MRSYPRFELPRAFRDYEDFLRVADQLIAAAGVDDYTYIWWDVRPHPKLGTVEVRGMDVQADGRGQRRHRRPDPGDGGEGDRPARRPRPRTARRSRSPTSRPSSHGLEAEILMVDESAAAPAPEVAAPCSRRSAPTPASSAARGRWKRSSGSSREGNGADHQRRVHGESGMEGLLSDLA